MTGGLTSKPGPQVEDPTVTHPRVPMKGDRAEGGEVVQQTIREGGQQVVVETELSGAGRETGGERGGGH